MTSKEDSNKNPTDLARSAEALTQLHADLHRAYLAISRLQDGATPATPGPAANRPISNKKTR